MAKEDEEEVARQEVDKFLRRRLDRLEHIYGQIVNRLWLAHGAAAGIVITIISSHTETKYRQLIWPLAIFIAGLAILVIGDLVQMRKDSKAVRRNQSAFSLLDVIMADVEAPLERLGLKGFRLKAQLASGALLVLGLVVGFFLFLRLQY